jgi:hypothetical protein
MVVLDLVSIVSFPGLVGGKTLENAYQHLVGKVGASYSESGT